VSKISDNLCLRSAAAGSCHVLCRCLSTEKLLSDLCAAAKQRAEKQFFFSHSRKSRHTVWTEKNSFSIFIHFLVVGAISSEQSWSLARAFCSWKKKKFSPSCFIVSVIIFSSSAFRAHEMALKVINGNKWKQK